MRTPHWQKNSKPLASAATLKTAHTNHEIKHYILRYEWQICKGEACLFLARTRCVWSFLRKTSWYWDNYFSEPLGRYKGDLCSWCEQRTTHGFCQRNLFFRVLEGLNLIRCDLLCFSWNTTTVNTTSRLLSLRWVPRDPNYRCAWAGACFAPSPNRSANCQANLVSFLGCICRYSNGPRLLNPFEGIWKAFEIFNYF